MAARPGHETYVSLTPAQVTGYDSYLDAAGESHIPNGSWCNPNGVLTVTHPISPTVNIEYCRLFFTILFDKIEVLCQTSHGRISLIVNMLFIRLYTQRIDNVRDSHFQVMNIYEGHWDEHKSNTASADWISMVLWRILNKYNHSLWDVKSNKAQNTLPA